MSSVSECDNCVRMITAWEQFGFIYVQTELCGRGRYRIILCYIVAACRICCRTREGATPTSPF